MLSFHRVLIQMYLLTAYPLNITNIRLTNGTGSNNGRVELLYNKEWGTICNAQLSTTGAITLCRMMNSR